VEEGFLAECAVPAPHADSLPHGARSFLAPQSEKWRIRLGERGRTRRERSRSATHPGERERGRGSEGEGDGRVAGRGRGMLVVPRGHDDSVCVGMQVP
jgi:hypothetical protein